MSLSGDNVDILGDMYYKFLVQDCMWSGTCKEDNSHETTNKFSDFSYFSTSPVYGSIFDIFNIDDENSLGEINCDPEYDTSDQDDSPLNGLSAEDTEIVDDSNEPTPSCSSSSPTPSTSSQSTLTGISTITPAGLLVADALVKPTTSNTRATSTGKSASTTKSTLSSKATKSSSKANSSTAKSTISAVAASVASTSNIRATSIATNSLVTPTISATSSAVVTNSVLNSQATITPSIKVEATGSAATAVGISTTSILKNSGKPRNPKSLYPERRKEHNNSEKKRRDHLRNAFNHLRDQIPKLKDGEKKAARVTILKESVSYVTLLKEKHRYLERTKNAETIKHENLLKRLKMLQSSTGATFNQQQPPTTSSSSSNAINNDSNLVYVQCNSSTVC